MVDYSSIFKQFNQQPRNLLEVVEQNKMKNMQAQQDETTLRKQKQEADFNEQSNPLKIAKQQFDNMSEQDKFVENELLQGSIELQPFIDAHDSQSIMQSLQMRRNKLAQNGLRTDEIDNAMQLAQQGDFDTLRQLTSSQIEGAKALGLLQDNSQNLPAGIQYQQKLEEGRQMMLSSDPQVREQGKNMVNDIRQVLKIEKTGTNMTFTPEGGVKNMVGATDALSQQAYAQKNAQSTATENVRATLGMNNTREEQNIKTNTEKQINQDKNISELNQKDALKIQELQQNLPVAEGVTANAIMGIDDTIEKLKKVKGAVGNGTAGWGSLLSGLPATDANNLKAQLLTINSRFGLDSLLALKNKGGSLGQIAVKEFEALQSSVSNLEQSQDPEQLKNNIDDAIKQMERTQGSIERAYLAEYGRVIGNPQEQQSQPNQQSNQERIRTWNPQTGRLE